MNGSTWADRLVALLGERLGLTPREAEVVGLLLFGLSDGGVLAHVLGVSRRTVYWHLTHIRGKLGVGTKAGIVARAWPVLQEALAG